MSTQTQEASSRYRSSKSENIWMPVYSMTISRCTSQNFKFENFKTPLVPMITKCTRVHTISYTYCHVSSCVAMYSHAYPCLARYIFFFRQVLYKRRIYTFCWRYEYCHKYINTLSTTFKLGMSKLSDWWRASKLSINSKKSNFMIFQPRQKRQKYDLAISIDTSPIEQVKETIFECRYWWKFDLEISHLKCIEKNFKVHWYPVQVKFLPFYSFS